MRTQKVAPSEEGAKMTSEDERRSEHTLKTGPPTRERHGRLLEGVGNRPARAEGEPLCCAQSGEPPPSESLNRVPPSEPIGDTRVRAAPYRLLNREIDGWGKGNGFTPQGGKTATFLGRENL